MGNQAQLQRVAAKTALSPHLPASQMEAALRMLDDFRLDSPTSTVNFVRALAQRFNLPDPLRRRLCVDLYEHLEKTPAPLRQDTGLAWESPSELRSLVANIHGEKSSGAAALPNGAEMLQRLAEAFNQWEHSLGPAASRETRQALQTALAEQTGNHPAVAQWPSIIDRKSLDAVPKDELQNLFQKVFGAVRDTLGPHGAEALLKRATEPA